MIEIVFPELALEFRRRGWSLMPIRPGSKQPVIDWKKFQYTPASADSVDRWLRRGWSLGIVTGLVSQLVVVDLDSPDAVAWAEREIDATPVRVKTPRGQHWYYAHPHVVVPNATGRIDIRGDGGYVVAAGSVGEDGTRYSAFPGTIRTAHADAGLIDRVCDWPEALPVFDPAWVVKANKGEEETDGAQ